MVAFQNIMRRMPWPLMIFIFFFVIIIIIIYKDNKDFFTLIRRVKSENYSDEEFIKQVSCYIRRHPFSLYNSDLRIKILPSLLISSNKAEVQRIIHKIRVVDVHDIALNNIIYVIFLLHENVLKNEYVCMLHKFKVRLQKKKKEWFLFFESDCEKIEFLTDYQEDPYLQGIKYYYMGVQRSEKGLLNEANEFFTKAYDKINEKSFYNLLVAKGYR